MKKPQTSCFGKAGYRETGEEALQNTAEICKDMNSQPAMAEVTSLAPSFQPKTEVYSIGKQQACMAVE